MNVGVFDSIGGNAERYLYYSDRFPEITLIPFPGRHPRECMKELQENNCEGIIFTSFSQDPPEFFERLKEAGVKYISTISVGHDHLNLQRMSELGIRAGNVPRYSPNSVAEYAVMMLLACCRNLRQQVLNAEDCRYKLNFAPGKEIRDLKIGIIGAGRIGSVTIECLSGFHPKKVYAYTRHYSERWKPNAEYADLDTIYSECDAIIYHADLNPSTHHMCNREAIAKMKDGVIIVNPSRGGITDSEALLWGIESGKIGALGLDVIDDEAVLRTASKFEECPIPTLGKLLAHENVIFTPHTAYYTEVANRDLEMTTIDNLVEYARTGHCSNELTSLD